MMCKEHNPRKIDSCMKTLINNLNLLTQTPNRETVACCCGHGKYPMTILIRAFGSTGSIYDLCSGIMIPRKKRFYKKDVEGYYYIPEVMK